MTVYVVDADVLIRANADFYAIDRVPQFWAWLLGQAQLGAVKMTQQNCGEVAGSLDILGRWMNRLEVKTALILPETTDRKKFQHVLDYGYGTNLNEVELQEIGRDPFLIAAALWNGDRVVVTREVSSPRKQRANRKIPDVCLSLRVEVITDYELYRRLDFNTK